MHSVKEPNDVPSLRRTAHPFVLLLLGIVIGAATMPLLMRAGQQFFALAPGDTMMVTCETGLGSAVSGTQARLDCAPAGAGATKLTVPTASTVAAPAAQPGGFTVTLAGIADGQTARGPLAVEALVSGGTAETVVFSLDGPAPARHTERRPPYFFLGDDNGVARGWDTGAAPDGDYTLTVTASDASGRSTQARARLRIANRTVAAQTVPAAQPAARTTELQYGAVAHLFYLDRSEPLGLARGAGFGWVRQQVHWKDVEGPQPGNYAWGELDPLVESVHGAGLKLLLSVVRSPGWYTADGGDGMPQDPKALGNFLAALAERYKGKVQAIEVWNEQNLAHENGGRITIDDAGRYVELLKESYARIKAVDPSIVVVAAAPASTGITDPLHAVSDSAYLEAMYSYGNGAIRGSFDVQGVHPGAAANPPETMVGDVASPAAGWTDHPTFYFRHIENVRALMAKYGLDDKPVWITEFGWATQNNSPGYEFGNAVSYQQQAEYIVGAMKLTRERYPWVEAMFVWNLNFAPLKANEGQPLHEQASFSLLDASGKPRPAYDAVKRYLGALRGQ
jgi:polysaccharide biosynthesis protein PslG